MGQKQFAIIFIALIVIAIGVYAISSLTQKKDETATASPSPVALLFNGQKTPGPGQSTDQIEDAFSEKKTEDLPKQALGTSTTPSPSPKIKQYTQPPAIYPVDQLTNKKAVLTTNKGVIEFEILPEAPKTASNFIFLSQEKFYNGLIFHRIVPGFVIQGGDPTGTGSGGPGYKFEDEPVSRKYDKGIVAMANSGPNTNGSQFFIMLEDNPTLPPSYTIFGKVIKGQEVVDTIRQGDVMQSVTIQSLN